MAIWLSLPIAMSLQLTAQFTSHALLDHFGVLSATLNVPGFIFNYVMAGRYEVSTLSLISGGDLLFYVPAFYASLRYARRERAGMRKMSRTRQSAMLEVAG